MCLASRHFFANAKVILVGDFNSVTHSATIQKLSERAPLSSAQLLAGLYFEVKSVKYIITCAIALEGMPLAPQGFGCSAIV